MHAVAEALTRIVGPDNVLTEPADVVRYVTDWTGAYRGRTSAVVRPRDRDDVAAVIEVCRRGEVAVVAQGGNTGLVAGGIPHAGEVVVSLERLSTPPEVDSVTGQASVAAGTTIEVLQRAARASGWAFGIDLASRGSATVGGTIATNAGGLRVLRYGDTRAQLVGIEAVLGNGRVVSHLGGLTRDNTGYHLPSLLAGSEGTLGIVTSARVRLVPRTDGRAVAIVGLPTTAAAVAASQQVRRATRDVEAVELMTAPGLALVADVKGMRPPVLAPACLLIEVVGPTAHEVLVGVVGDLSGVVDSAVAEGAAGERLWEWRETHTEAINTLGPPLKLDVTLPVPVLADFIEGLPALTAGENPEARTWVFGHVADGNVHVNITTSPESRDRLTEVVLREVAAYGGSISSEHGIGHTKRRWLDLVRSPEEIDAMRRIKLALDPDSIMNPGVLLPT
jgi:FAD/FMN-containing dehydrogenase